MMQVSKALRTRGGRRDGRAGFLLAEALATMAISAFLLVALSSVVSLMLRASDRTGRAAQGIEYATRLMASLTREIEQIAPLHWSGSDAGFVFAGGPQAMTYAYEETASDGTAKMRVGLLKSENTHLLREEAALPPTSRSVADLAIEKRQVMSGGHLAVRFAYYGALPNGQEVLTDAWDRTDRMPVAIRVSLIDSSGALRGSTRVTIHVDAERGCFLPGRRQCSLAPPDDAIADKPVVAAAPVDPDDTLGWMRYIP